jgi:hypothetical protein
MEPIVGAFFYAHRLFALSESERRRSLERLVSLGITTVITEADEYDDAVIADTHAAGLQLWGGLSCFLSTNSEGNLLELNPSLCPVLSTGRRRPQMEWYNAVIPTDKGHNERRLARSAAIVTDHAVDGFLLDFVRWPMHWELELRPGYPPPLDSSFDQHTLQLFRSEYDVDVPASDPGAAATWIAAHAGHAWIDFKCGVITRFVEQMRQRLDAARGAHVPLGVCAVPLQSQWVGQRFSDLQAHIDVLCPMSYHSLLYRPASWIAANVAELATGIDKPVTPILQIDTDGSELGADFGRPISDEEVTQIVSDAIGAGAHGVISFTGTELLRSNRGAAFARGLG